MEDKSSVPSSQPSQSSSQLDFIPFLYQGVSYALTLSGAKTPAASVNANNFAMKAASVLRALPHAQSLHLPVSNTPAFLVLHDKESGTEMVLPSSTFPATLHHRGQLELRFAPSAPVPSSSVMPSPAPSMSSSISSHSSGYSISSASSSLSLSSAHEAVPYSGQQSVDRLMPSQTFAAEEQRIRVELAAAYRLFDLFGWTDTIYGHLTARVPSPPGSPSHFLINPFGLLYSEITASSLVKVNLDGEIVDPGSTSFGINRAGYVIHSAIHAAREDVACVMHSHAAEATAVSCLHTGFLPLTQTAHIVGRVSYHNYEGIAVDEAEKKRLEADLGPENKVLLLRNHGAVTCGRSIGEAFLLMHNLVAACKIQIMAMSAAGGNLSALSMPQKEVADKTEKIAAGFNSEGVGAKELAAYMRYLDQIDSSYRH